MSDGGATGASPVWPGEDAQLSTSIDCFTIVSWVSSEI